MATLTINATAAASNASDTSTLITPATRSPIPRRALTERIIPTARSIFVREGCDRFTVDFARGGRARVRGKD
jgi:hypothetical protein